MTLNERYRTIYSRLWGFKDHCDEQHNITMRELEKELQALRPEVTGVPEKILETLRAARFEGWYEDNPGWGPVDAWLRSVSPQDE